MSSPRLKPLFTWRTAIARSSLPASARHVALTLSLHMNEIGESAFPSLQKLSEETGLHKETVHRHLAVLEEEQYLWVRRGNLGRGGRAQVNEYQTRLPERSAEPTLSPEEASPGPSSEASSTNPQVSGGGERQKRSAGVDPKERSAEPTLSETTVGWGENNGRIGPEQRSAEPTGVVDLEDVKRGRTTQELAAAPRPERALDPLIELLCVEAELSPEGSRAMAPEAVRGVAVAAAKIRALGGTPELAHLAVVNYPTHFRDASISAPAIAKHWARLQRPGPFSLEGRPTRPAGPSRAADEDWSDLVADDPVDAGARP